MFGLDRIVTNNCWKASVNIDNMHITNDITLHLLIWIAVVTSQFTPEVNWTLVFTLQLDESLHIMAERYF